MKPFKSRYEQLEKKLSSVQNKIYDLEKEKEEKRVELERYCKRHKSMSYESLETADTEKLLSIYAYFDKKYFIEWQGGLRCDERGMALHYWLNDDPDYLVFCLSSTCNNICFSGSTHWVVPAITFEDKIKVIKRIKEDISKIIKQEV